MLSLMRVQWTKFFLFTFFFCLFLEMVPEEAEAARRRRGRAFGRRNVRAGVQRRARVARGVRRGRGRVVARNRNRNFNNNDIFGLDLEPVNAFSNLALDPTGDLQRLQAFSNLAVNRNGQLVEVFNGNNLLSTRQPLVLFNGQVIGGAFGGVLPETAQQIRLLNETGNFGLLRR